MATILVVPTELLKWDVFVTINGLKSVATKLKRSYGTLANVLLSFRRAIGSKHIVVATILVVPTELLKWDVFVTINGLKSVATKLKRSYGTLANVLFSFRRAIGSKHIVGWDF